MCDVQGSGFRNAMFSVPVLFECTCWRPVSLSSRLFFFI